ncbi:hypothetical protein [Fervidibacillus halotolerans]|uniref:WYL domain-containing protein n=1 Tax=Fervidibacillus halotolerans TaxID=2980027 RepID=A0A9E8M097_9BACI|nr:hypothetical protein [Fervidibacillus halotolerans]WAA13093.1 hypothetical protein OE105_02905 [Fervidibacillus halotolerans]
MYQYFMKSLVHHIPLQIIYVSKKGEFTKRIIYVKKVKETYIFAYCLTKRHYRKFSTEQILAAIPYKKKKTFESAS